MEIIYNVLLWILVYCQAGLSENENCESALGMQNKRIPDDSVTASSSLSKKHSPALGRLDGRGAWCSGREESPYIQISLDEEKLITVLKTQGSRMDTAWARKYGIKYLKGGNWTSYHKELLGNRNSGSLQKNILQPPIRTRSIRIYPKQPDSASFDPNAILVPCLRLELYGCSPPAECKDPGRPPNGERRGSDFNHGKQVTFVCNQGFVLIGSATSVCHKGKWSHGIPECKASCKDPGIPNNGERRGDTFVDGDSVEFTCLERFTLIGPSVIRCLGDKWSSAIPQCKASCPDPGVPQNGNRLGSNFGHGHNLQFTCKSGFWLVGSQLIVCDEGTWSNALPECKAVCSNPGVPGNGERIGDDFGDGQMVAYRCHSGFNLVGSPTAFCVAGQWNSTKPACKASCRDPGVPQNGRRVGSNFGHGNEVTFVCGLEFSLVGSSSITCHDGKWSSFVPVCKASCKNPGAPGNGVSHGNDFGHNRQVRFSCLRGFQLTGSSSVIVCINGRWSGPVPDCKAVCPAPKTPVNGERIGNSYLDGQQVAFRCRLGYTLIGSQVMRCVKGKWDKTEPVCSAHCPNPSVPQNGRMLGIVSSRRHGDKVNYSCDAGFKLEGVPTITCVDGKWNASAPLCKDINECLGGLSDCDRRALCKNTEGSYTCTCTDGTLGDGKSCTTVCPAPKTPVNGERIGNSYLVGQQVAFRCRRGYTLIGSRVMRCVEGKWSNAEPECRAHCSDPSIPKNGRLLNTASSKQHGEKVKYACDGGFKLEGSSSSTCVDGKWSSSAPQCKDINECLEGLSDCDKRALCKNTEGSYTCTCTGGTVGDGKSCTKLCADPGLPTNGGRKGNDFSDGKAVTFTCQPGYKIVGRHTIRCQGGVWSSPPPKCQRLCMIPKNPVHGVIIQDRFDSGGIIEFACYSGFQLIGSSVLRCVGGQWNSTKPQCRIMVCPRPANIPHGSYEGNNFASGGSVKYSCDETYTLEGPSLLLCIDGHWNGELPVCRAPCSPPSSPLNGFVFGDSPLHQATVQYWCEKGFTLHGPSSRQCIDGKWDFPAPVCEEPSSDSSCPKPRIPPNAYMLSSLSQRKWFNNGDQISYRCHLGYSPLGLNFHRCLNGRWTRLFFKCNEISCGHPGAPVNGKMLNWEFTYKSKVKYLCNDGYFLLGPRERICQANQTWTGIQPKCSKINCGALPTPINAEKISETSTLLEGQVTFRCIGGQFKLVGPSTRTCLLSGRWSGEQPRCQLIVCGDPGTPDHGSKVVHRGFYYGGSIEFMCNTAYELKGSQRIYCMKSGSWSNSKPLCLAPCSNPGYLRNGKRIGKHFSHGRSVRFRCNRKFRLVGASRITCNNGQWNRKVPRCQRNSG